MSVIKGVVKIVVLLILLNAVVFGGYYFYSDFVTQEIQEGIIPFYNPEISPTLINASGEVSQFYPNMRFNHNEISYFINKECPNDKITGMERAFDILSQEIEVVSFYPTLEDLADILIGCDANSYEKEENVFLGGEGGPTKIVNSSIPVVSKGKILLYNESRSKCDDPILEIHELLHVFGYDHINDSSKIMYPYLSCDQELNPELISHLKELYSIEPYAELYFEDISASKAKQFGKDYLNLNVSIDNGGLIDAENVRLNVYAGGKLEESFDLQTIKLGGGKSFYVNNLALSDSEKVTVNLSSSTYEESVTNNNVELNFA